MRVPVPLSLHVDHVSWAGLELPDGAGSCEI